MATRGQTCTRSMGEEYCILHPEEKLHFECKHCNELTCMECVGTIHQGHVMVRIKQSIGEMVANIEEFIKKTEETTLPKVVKEIKLTISALRENKEKCQHEIKEVQKQEKRLKELVEQHSATKVSKFELLLKHTTDLLNNHKSYLETIQHEIEEDIKECKQTVKSGNEVLQHDTLTQVVKRKPNVSISKIPEVTSPSFSPCEDPNQYIEKALGDIIGPIKSGGLKKAKVTPEYKFLDQPKTLYESSTTFSVEPNSMYCTPINNIWMLDTKRKLHCHDHTGKEMQTLKPDVELCRICTHPTTAEMFGTHRRDKSIRRIDTQSGQTSIMFKTTGEPITIGCTSESQLVVSMFSGKVMLFSFNGEIRYTYNYTVSGWIPCISVCPINSNIALSGGTDGVVVVLDRALQKLYEYKPQGTCKAFCTTATFYDKYLLIGDRDNKNILVLVNGALVRHIQTKNMSHVEALSVQQDGVLCVGCVHPGKLLQIKYVESRKSSVCMLQCSQQFMCD